MMFNVTEGDDWHDRQMDLIARMIGVRGGYAGWRERNLKDWFENVPDWKFLRWKDEDPWEMIDGEAWQEAWRNEFDRRFLLRPASGPGNPSNLLIAHGQ